MLKLLLHSLNAILNLNLNSTDYCARNACLYICLIQWPACVWAQ